MEIFGGLLVTDFAEKHPHSRKALARFLEIVRQAQWFSLIDVKAAFPATDYVNETYIFNIGGNHYRLLAAIDFEAQYIDITEILTHERYNRKKL